MDINNYRIENRFFKMKEVNAQSDGWAMISLWTNPLGFFAKKISRNLQNILWCGTKSQ